METEAIKNVIVTTFKSETMFCRNKDWVSDHLKQILSTIECDFYCIEMLMKYGEINDFICTVFDNKKDFNEFKKNKIEKCRDSKWLNTQYFSDGSVKKFNLNL
jgi:hypothetical protein